MVLKNMYGCGVGVVNGNAPSSPLSAATLHVALGVQPAVTVGRIAMYTNTPIVSCGKTPAAWGRCVPIENGNRFSI